MSRQRLMLLLGLLLLVLSAAKRVGATETEVEATGYGGSASGGWACGPSARVNYGGAAGAVRVRTSDDPNDTFVVEGAGAIERRDYRQILCDGPCPSTDAVPTTTTMGGGSARVGYDWQWAGFRVGALTWEAFGSDQDRKPTLYLFPDCALRIGPLDSLRGEIGVGSYTGATILRPGAYVGLAYSPAKRWDIALHFGGHSTFDAMTGLRGDIALRVPLTDAFHVGAGVALSYGRRDFPEPEGRLSLGGNF